MKIVFHYAFESGANIVVLPVAGVLGSTELIITQCSGHVCFFFRSVAAVNEMIILPLFLNYFSACPSLQVNCWEWERETSKQTKLSQFQCFPRVTVLLNIGDRLIVILILIELEDKQVTTGKEGLNFNSENKTHKRLKFKVKAMLFIRRKQCAGLP